MKNTAFTILLGGEISSTERLLSLTANTRAIAADSGMRHASALNLMPELWVGDFDSTDQALRDTYSSVEQQPYPAAKAVTDGEIAVEEAIKRGARELILVGALGGERSDHALQHYAYALSLAQNGFRVVLTSGDEEAYPLLKGTLTLDQPEHSLLSVIGFTDLSGLDIDNVEYPLDNFSLPFGSSRTVSNISKGKVQLHLREGKAIVLCRPYDLTGK
jgi:thiamine pyrophosphokinase